jgi:lipopolysaccharide export system protein LptA
MPNAIQKLKLWGQRSACCLVLCALSLGAGPLNAQAQQEELKVKYKTDKTEFDNQTGIFRLTGKVEMTVKDIQITSETIDYDTRNRVLSSRVPFVLTQNTPNGPRRLEGDNFKYDVRLGRIDASNVYLEVPAQTSGQKVYILGDQMTAYNDGQRVVFSNGTYTTCNHFEHRHKPEDLNDDSVRMTHYNLDADILDFEDGVRVLAWNARIAGFESQLFWFPFWYVPLEGVSGFRKPDLDAGQNNVEGYFTRFKGYYQFNEFHDGYWYLTLMQNKGVGLGFQHDWIAAPNSISRIFFYGLPVTRDLLGIPQALFSGPPSTTDTITTQQTTGGGGPLGGLSEWLSNKFEDRDLQISHKQRLLPQMEADFLYADRDFYEPSAFLASRNPQRRFEFTLRDNEIFPLDDSTDLRLDTNLSLKQSVNSPTQITFPSNTQGTRLETTTYNQTQSRTATISSAIGQSTLNLNTNWSENLTRIRRDTITPTRTNTENATPQGNETWNTTLDLKIPFTEKTTFSTNMAYNSNLSGVGSGNTGLTQTLQPRMSLNQALDWGSLDLRYEDFFTLSPDRAAAQAQSSGQIKKLPEIYFQLNPFFQETFPITLETTLGRYLDPAAVIATENLNEIGRAALRLSLGSKDYDLGLGSKINYGGTSFEQRLYQTQDAEYILNTRVTLTNNLLPFFVPSITYERAFQDLENNNSPFVNFDPLQLRTLNALTAKIGLVNIPEFTWNFYGGYDYINRNYQQFRTDMVSEVGSNFILRASTQYQPVHIRDQDVGQPLKDINNQPYHHGDPVNGPTVMVRPEDVGSLSPYGGRWGNLTMGFRWRNNDQVFATGALSTFGLDSGIPEGIEIGSDIAYDLHLGRINSLNGLFRWSFGDTWLTHTEIDLTLSVQPTRIPTQWAEVAALEIPFKIVVRKDLHDFILTASWDSFYQQFNINLALLAFPYSTSDILGNVNSLGQQANSLGSGFPQ